jgi:DNA-directed RNA polymerase subunit H (RpoH/RPB5)
MTSTKINNIKEMMVQRGFETIKEYEDYLLGENINTKEYIYIRIFNGKLELNTVRKFLCTNFTFEGGNVILKNSDKVIVQLVIVCTSFQNSHIKEFVDISNHIQLIRSDFFNINITKKAPLHQKVPSNLIQNKKELPIIKITDPNCIFYNFKKRDVIRVVRSDGDICYRLVK